MKFKLEIEIEDRIDDGQIITALEGVAQRFRDNQYLRAIKAEGAYAFGAGTIWQSSIRIRDIQDANGAKIGSWKIVA